MHDKYKNEHSQENQTVSTIPFTEKHMRKLLTAYESLRDLETLVALISEIDPDNGLLRRLWKIDALIQDLSPLSDPDLDYDQQVYTDLLENDSISISLKAHILLGSMEEYESFKTKQKTSDCISGTEPLPVPEANSGHTADFTIDNMVDLLLAYYGFCSLNEVVGLFAGAIPTHKILCGLSFLADLIDSVSPLYHLEYDDDEIENAEYLTTLNSTNLCLMDKARILMGESPV